MLKNKKTLIIGASTKENRPVRKAIEMLVKNGHSVVALGQNTGEIAAIKIQTKAVPVKNIDTVSLYIRPSLQKNYYNYIVEAKPKRVIFNPGTENPEFSMLLKTNNIEVENACTIILLTTNQY